MTFENMTEYLENVGYAVDGMDAEEVDALAEAEGFKEGDDRKYHYRGY